MAYYVKDGHSAAGACTGAAMSAGVNSYIGHLLVLGRARKRLTYSQKRIMMSCQSLPKCRIAADSERNCQADNFWHSVGSSCKTATPVMADTETWIFATEV